MTNIYEYVVKMGSYHKWNSSKTVYEAESYEDAKNWIFENLGKYPDGTHMYVDLVQKGVFKDDSIRD